MINKKLEQIQKWRVIIMAFAAFVFNTTEFVPIALLTDIAQSFAMQPSEVGLMMTVYAWTVMIMSLPAMLATGKMERKSLLIKLFLIFIISHLLSFIAWNFEILLISRLGIALAHSVFWSITASLVMRIAPKNKQTWALSLLSIGTALATILGLPLGRMIGQAFGWRLTFGLIGLIAFLVMLALMRLLPPLPSKNSGSLASLPGLAKRPLLMGLYATTMTIIAAHFTAYTYIEPFMIEIGKLAPDFTTAILLIFGVAGIFGSLLFNRFYRFAPTRFFLFTLLGLSLALSLLWLASGHLFSMIGLALLWGICIACIGLALQMRVLQLAPDATDVATAILSGIYNAGIGAGALFGNQIMQHFGLQFVGFSGALIGLFALTIFLYAHFRFAK